MTDIEVAEGIVSACRAVRKRQWIHNYRQAAAPRCREQSRVSMRRHRAQHTPDPQVVEMRLRTAERRWGEVLAGLRFEDQPGAD